MTAVKKKLFRKRNAGFDVIVNAILWDTARQDHLIYRTESKNSLNLVR